MTKEEIIKLILELRPIIFKERDLESLDECELLNIYTANRFLSYYRLLMKQQMISVICRMTDAHKEADLYVKDYEEVKRIYLIMRDLTPYEFEDIVESALKDFDAQAMEDGNMEYLTFSRDEKIIATGVLIPEPTLTDDDIKSQSMLMRAEEITREIEELETENAMLEVLIKNDKSRRMDESYDDISYNNKKIDRLRKELSELMGLSVSDQDRRVRK